MASLATLVGVVLLAIVTPLLPLQPPDAGNTDVAYQYAAPTASPLWLHDFALDVEAIAATPAAVAELRTALKRDLPELNARVIAAAVEVAAQEQLLDEQDANGAPLSAEDRAARLKPFKAVELAARRAIYRRSAEIEDTIQGPYRNAGFAPLGGLSRWMVRARYALFGDRQLNSLCGRDLLGRDLLSRTCWGSRISLMVGLVATIVSLAIGVTYGAVSGYFGGRLDNVMMRLVDVMYSIPFIFVVIFILTVLNEERTAERLRSLGITKITVFYLVVGAIYWLTMARVVRGQIISLKHQDFVEAARSLGARAPRIIFRHLLPNVLSVVLVYLTLTIPRVMLFEAFLSFLGLGVDPPDVSWGLLANEGIKVITPVRIYWWLVLFPSLALGSTLLALNFLGDGLRDALDPRLKDR
ncbi:MAG: ABC transporter permease [Pirellulales bacterium]|nr:ABC transporter permease [Pirellulales bacterium]